MTSKFIKTQFAYGEDVNDLDPWSLELWGMEILRLLQERYLAPNFVNRDYGTAIQSEGETINARLSGQLLMKRRNKGANVKVQRLKGTTTPVKLDQLWHTSFYVDDWGQTRTFGNIIDDYLIPAADGLAKGVNGSVLGLAPHFLGRRYGELGGLSATNVQSYFAGFNGVMNEGQDWGGAPIFIGNNTRTLALQQDIFAKVNESGSNETLRRALLGSIYDMDPYKSSEVPGNLDRAATNTTATSSAKAKGSATIVVTSATGIEAGSRISVAGKPYKVSGVSTNTLTLEGGLLEAVASGAVVSAFGNTTVDASDGLDEGHAEELVFDDTVSTGDIVDIVNDDATYSTYTVIQNDNGDILLDRPLEKAVADGAKAYFWPAGNYNFGFSKNAILMVARSLPQVPEGLGARSAVVNYNGLPIRITLSYEGLGQKTLVTLDILGGLKPVMHNEGGVMLA